MAVSVVVAMTTLALTGTLPGAQVLTGFSNATVWLIFTAFLFARALTVTGLGRRVAYLFIQRFGRSALTLGYSMAGANLVVAPFVPSDTARGGGIVFPITRSLAQVFGSEPGPTANRLGTFLILSAFHSNYAVSAMFLTGMAANALIAEFARKIAHVELTWGNWALAASLPGLLTLALAPYVIYRLHPPEVRDTQAAREHAAEALAQMGPMSRREITLSFIFLAVMGGWVTSPWHGVNNTIVALAGVSAILLCRVVTWDELLTEGRAWDALIWFGPLVMMSDALTESGVIRILSGALFHGMRGWSWPHGGGGAGGGLLVHSLRFRQPDGARHGALPEFSGGGRGCRRAAAGDGSGAGVFFEPGRRHDALRHGLGAGFFRSGLRRAGHVVARGPVDFAR